MTREIDTGGPAPGRGSLDSRTSPQAPRFGLLLPSRELVMQGHDDVRPLLALAKAAQSAGFDAVWVGDSFSARPRADPLSVLAAVAGATESLTLGTAVLLGGLRHPIPTAHAIASLDQLCGGRLILGLGAGFPYPATEAEFAAAGVPFKQRVGRLAETVRLWRALWSSDGPVTFEGRYWSVQELLMRPRPTRPGGPPILLAGEGEQTLRRAGELVGGWLTYSPTPELFGQHWETVRGAAQNAGKNDPVAGLYVTVTLDEEAERARARLDEYLTAYYGFASDVMGQLQAFYAGPQGGFVEWVKRFLNAGPSEVIVRLGVLDGYEQALDQVAPMIQQLRPSSLSRERGRVEQSQH